MKKKLAVRGAYLTPTVQTLIDLKDLLGGNVPPWAGMLFLMIYCDPGITQQGLAAWSGLSKFAVSRVVREYEKRGIVVALRNGRDKRLDLSPDAVQIGHTLNARNRAMIRKVAVALP